MSDKNHEIHISTQPPRAAERFLCFFLSDMERECAPGDLAEIFQKLVITEGVGSSRAKLWYWKQVLGSVGYFLRCFMRSRSPFRILGNIGIALVGCFIAFNFFYLLLQVPALVVMCNAVGAKIDQIRFVNIVVSLGSKSLESAMQRHTTAMPKIVLAWSYFIGPALTCLLGFLLSLTSRKWLRFLGANLMLFSSGSLAVMLVMFASYPAPLLGSVLFARICWVALGVAVGIAPNFWSLRRLMRNAETIMPSRWGVFVMWALPPFVIASAYWVPLLLRYGLLFWNPSILIICAFILFLLSAIGLLAAFVPARPRLEST